MKNEFNEMCAQPIFGLCFNQQLFILGRIGSAFGHRPGPVPGTASRLTGEPRLRSWPEFH